MTDIEAIVYVYGMLVGLVVFFVAGWLLTTASYCLMAFVQGKPVRPVLKMMMEEW